MHLRRLGSITELPPAFGYCIEDLKQVPGVVIKPQKEHLPESQPRLQQRAAALARSLWARGPGLGERAPHRAAEEAFYAARTAPVMEGLGCVLGQDQTWQWMSSKRLCGTPGEDKELWGSTHFWWNCTNITVLSCKFYFDLCFNVFCITSYIFWGNILRQISSLLISSSTKLELPNVLQNFIGLILTS